MSNASINFINVLQSLYYIALIQMWLLSTIIIIIIIVYITIHLASLNTQQLVAQEGDIHLYTSSDINLLFHGTFISVELVCEWVIWAI